MDDCSSLDDGCVNHAAMFQTDEKQQRDWDRFITRSARNLARRTPDRALEADDIAQVGRLRLFRLGPAVASRNWVGKVLFNEMRREAGRPASPLPLDDAALAVTDQQVSSEAEILTRMSVRRWVAGLPLELRRVYELLYVDHATQRTAADKLGCSQSRVNQLHQELKERGRLELRALLARAA
jgi:RNA polymerase sigma factor (sigma-70 family)